MLKDIKEKTSLNSRQLDILIRLNFFEDFGHNKYLLDVNEVYEKFATVKVIAKKKMDELGVSEYVLKKYCNKETAAQWREIDNKGLIKDLCSQINDESLSVVEQIDVEIQHLGYAIYTNKDISENYYIVIEFDNSKNATRPRCILYNINSGKSIKTRINRSEVFKNAPFGLMSIINMPVVTYAHKKVKIDDKWQDSEEVEPIMCNYEVIK